MFSKSKKQKSETAVQQPKLRGMPALKHMRSTKREEYLLKKTKNAMPTISDLEQQNERQQTYTKDQFDDERNVQMKVDVVPASSYKPSTQILINSSPPVQAQYADRKSDSIGSDIVLYEDATPSIAKRVDYHEMEIGSPSSNAPWHFSKADSGYKSQGDSYDSQDKKKTKKAKRKNEARSKATSGLHDIKQQRKASRESVSHSMRALTPKERESIRFLENVIKIAKENDSADEVFNSDSDGNDNFEVSRKSSCMKINEDTDEAIDYGYASVNDVSRRFSIDSIESVGSIIDLVGNLSTSASSSTSPLYAAVDKPQKNQIVEQDDTRTQEAIGGAETSNHADRDGDNHKLLHWKDSYSGDARKHYEDVLSHFDEVINSFCIPTDEENMSEDVENTMKTSEKEDVSNKLEILSTEKNHEEERACETTSGNEAKERVRKEKKYRDPEKEKERKERKKRRKEEKRAIRREQEQREHNEARLREEDIARHVDTITALTQDMIMTAQQEPIYAKVDKTKKRKKDVNQNIESSKRNDVIDPPPPFANDHVVQIQDVNQDYGKSSNPAVPSPLREKFNFTSTPLASPELCSPKSPDESCSRSNNEHAQSTANCSNHANLITPSFYKCHTTVDAAVLQVSPTLLHESTESLRHVIPSVTSGKSILIKPKHSTNSDKIHIPDEDTNQHTENHNAESSTSSHNNFSRRLSPTQNCRMSRPLSLNLETTEKPDLYSTTSIKPYSSFREDKDDGGERNNRKTKPFVITALKKPVQLC